ncbi:SusD/RagB family nutrient-binding outer membrane lipoprotein [Xanthovirga aplysinae]|uniref:SusD/RagB family nutrient-binding outer membrane lipoprotein n=1 Tax=Xanthovirga aplysinae TaxID=2529853 RepID=UPI0012BBAC41|nr:SusD/RagB family nutrient-binding outer membrane lipoprotein [Xanthovirga aplysinae]MTI31052.1 SusD/RagB family nutrient-binding outer membrane lipoprotein [Xanthovirga aplysinae]
MKKNILYKAIFLGLILMGTQACVEKFEEVNKNINDPEKVSLNLVLTSAQADVFEGFGDDWDRFSGLFTQHFAGNHASGVSYDRYIFRNADEETTFDFMYRRAFMDLNDLRIKGAEQEAWSYVGVAEILTAIGLGHLTDVYGDIPWSQALNSEEYLYPVYDSQESIYKEIQALLSSGLANLEKNSDVELSGDLIYGGSKDNWKAAAYVLQARYHNHLSEIDPGGSAEKALAAIDKAKDAGFDGSMDFQYNYEGSVSHLNPWYSLYLNNLIIASKVFMDALLNNNDPRVHAYFDQTPYGTTDPVGHVGKENGYGTDPNSYSPVGPYGYFGKEGSPVLIATYFEMLFIEAEAALRLENQGRADEAYNMAVKASLDKVMPTILEDAEHYSSEELEAIALEMEGYLNNFTGLTGVSLEQVMTEKHKAMFTQGVESWVDVRRHDYKYPSYLHIPIANGSPIGNNFIRRILYPQTELEKNSKNVPDVGIFDKLWWDK